MLLMLSEVMEWILEFLVEGTRLRAVNRKAMLQSMITLAASQRQERGAVWRSIDQHLEDVMNESSC